MFPELCHACGGCAKVCPSGAIREEPQRDGTVDVGRRGHIRFAQGLLDVGRPMATPVIDAVRKQGYATLDAVVPALSDPPVVVVDCPPGASCPLLAAVSEVDYVVLVTEPTPFGLHDLRIAVETMRTLGLPCGVVINRCDIGSRCVHDYCQKEGLPLLLEIAHDRRIAEAYSRGASLIDAVPSLAEALRAVLTALVESAGDSAVLRTLQETAR